MKRFVAVVGAEVLLGGNSRRTAMTAIAAAALLPFVLTTGSALAVTPTFINIADTTGPYSTFGNTSINDGGTVAFWATLDAGGKGIYSGSGGPITTITTVNGQFSNLNFNPSINNAGVVAFHGDLSAGGEGIFTGSGGPVTTVVDTSGPLFGVGDPVINTGGTMAFIAAPDAGGWAIVAMNGAMTTIADTSGPLSGFGGGFGFNNGGTAAFWATLDPGTDQGIFSGSGGALTTILILKKRGEY